MDLIIYWKLFFKIYFNYCTTQLLLCGIGIYTSHFSSAEGHLLQKVDQKYLESSEVWCWRRVEKITWNDHWETKYYIESRRIEISYIQQKWRLTGLVIPCVG